MLALGITAGVLFLKKNQSIRFTDFHFMTDLMTPMNCSNATVPVSSKNGLPVRVRRETSKGSQPGSQMAITCAVICATKSCRTTACFKGLLKIWWLRNFRLLTFGGIERLTSGMPYGLVLCDVNLELNDRGGAQKIHMLSHSISHAKS